ncbi:MAG: type II secretion system protein [Phycisphaerae bacterium]|nr:type II secretion system protein [Phycisphaerae bacterium]
MRYAVRPSRISQHAFTLAELLVVLGIVSLLMAVLLPALRTARQQAVSTHCGTNLQSLGKGLQQGFLEFNFYPLWDDGGNTVRFTWVDLMVERRYAIEQVGYCGEDDRPDYLAEARGQAFSLLYPPNRSRFGINYSYGISVPLSTGSWAMGGPSEDGLNRRFAEHDRYPSRRVLGADAIWSGIYNLSGEAYRHRMWNFPSQTDNTIAYRHPNFSANFLHQDGHVERARYAFESSDRIDTVARFIWHADESIFVGPDSQHMGAYYPAFPPPDVVPEELDPRYYTDNRLWTQTGVQ